uniref:Transmembrane protein n=1 Tax=Heterorhabditis bacteriophora TaxID=37862 RepID=A0A1I7WCJ2_HETBA
MSIDAKQESIHMSVASPVGIAQAEQEIDNKDNSLKPSTETESAQKEMDIKVLQNAVQLHPMNHRKRIRKTVVAVVVCPAQELDQDPDLSRAHVLVAEITLADLVRVRVVVDESIILDLAHVHIRLLKQVQVVAVLLTGVFTYLISILPSADMTWRKLLITYAATEFALHMLYRSASRSMLFVTVVVIVEDGADTVVVVGEYMIFYSIGYFNYSSSFYWLNDLVILGSSFFFSIDYFIYFSLKIDLLL